MTEDAAEFDGIVGRVEQETTIRLTAEEYEALTREWQASLAVAEALDGLHQETWVPQ